MVLIKKKENGYWMLLLVTGLEENDRQGIGEAYWYNLLMHFPLEDVSV